MTDITKTSLTNIVGLIKKKEIKSEEVLGEHGLLDAQDYDIQDEASLFDYSPNAESIDEEDLEIGVSDEMKGVYS